MKIVGQYGPLRLPNRYIIVRFHAFLPLNSFSSIETINQVDILLKQTIRSFPTLYKFKQKNHSCCNHNSRNYGCKVVSVAELKIRESQKKDFCDFENIKIENTFSKKFDVDKFRSLLRLDRIENNS